ncbi:cytochrome c maturation protein CcmE [Daejeonella sp. H1SJ63]|uniref:cytochrome c maturation protein CcmE n=1 Tax=Daejeonella sp. H1SJ63 TaxID=3034145 RepID=UPI003204D5F8
MKRSSILSLILIAFAIGFIISIYTDSSTYASIKEAKETENELHIVGHLIKEKEMYYNPIKDANYFSFYLKDENNEECKVVFTGAKPQDFERSEKLF